MLKYCLTTDLNTDTMTIDACDAETQATLTLCRAEAAVSESGGGIEWGPPEELEEAEEFEDEEGETQEIDERPGAMGCQVTHCPSLAFPLRSSLRQSLSLRRCQAAYNTCEEPWKIAMEGCPQALQEVGLFCGTEGRITVDGFTKWDDIMPSLCEAYRTSW